MHAEAQHAVGRVRPGVDPFEDMASVNITAPYRPYATSAWPIPSLARYHHRRYLCCHFAFPAPPVDLLPVLPPSGSECCTQYGDSSGPQDKDRVFLGVHYLSIPARPRVNIYSTQLLK